MQEQIDELKKEIETLKLCNETSTKNFGDLLLIVKDMTKTLKFLMDFVGVPSE